MHLTRHHSADRWHRDTRSDAAFQAGDADHIELVQVGREDREELRPLQQRHPLVVRGQIKDPLVEGEPGQFSVQEARSGGSPGAGTGSKSSITVDTSTASISIS